MPPSQSERAEIERTHAEIDLDIALGVLGEYAMGHDQAEVALSRVQEGVTGLRSDDAGKRQALELAQTALHKLCLARGSTDGYGHVFAAINEAL